MQIKFSEQFSVKQKAIEETGVFDVILDVDTRVFVDPALLEICSIPEFNRICAENQRVRDAINAYFDFGKKKKISKAQILSLMHTNTGFCQTMFEAYKSAPKTVYNFSKDKSGEYIWYSAAKKLLKNTHWICHQYL